MLEYKGAKTGLITTKGFRDSLEMRRAHKPELWNLFLPPPPMLVPRYLRLGVTERIDYKGDIIEPLSEDEVKDALKIMKKHDIESIAVCTLFSYINDIHERRIKEIIQDEFPEAYVSISSEILPQIREYERTSTTVVNAYLMPVVDKYLRKIENELEHLGAKVQLHIMESNGGIMTSKSSRKKPVRIIESGPSAGVIASSYFGNLVGYNNVISFDMGGTTAKAGLIKGGVPEIATDYEVGGLVHTISLSKGGGYPISVPVIDLAEVGAGGGSIAWIDAGGALKVGPQSAGADPGPVCYSIGGTEPTVTDANLILGFLNPDYFLGGEIKLDYESSYKAIKEKIGDPLNISPIEAAHGIYEVVNTNMADVIKCVSVQKGYDPREFCMIAFGGAGPIHAINLAEEVSIPKIIIPKVASGFSALGMLETDLKHDFAHTYQTDLDHVDLTDVNNAFEQLESEGYAILRKEAIPQSKIKIQRMLDMRYIGQHHEVIVEISNKRLQKSDLQKIKDSFHKKHESLYAYSEREHSIETLNLRITAYGEIVKTELKKMPISNEDASQAFKSKRKVFFNPSGEYIESPIYDGSKLVPNNLIRGPAIIEEKTTTIVVFPSSVARVDPYLSVIIEKEK
jgi:N-methylhydantoinase A